MKSLLHIKTSYSGEEGKTVYDKDSNYLGSVIPKYAVKLRLLNYDKLMKYPITAFVYNVNDGYQGKKEYRFDKKETLKAIDFWIMQLAYWNQRDYVMNDTVDQQDEILLRELIETRDWILKQKPNTKFTKNSLPSNNVKSRIEDLIHTGLDYQLKEYCDENKIIEFSAEIPYKEIPSLRGGYPFCRKVVRMSSRKYARSYKKKFAKMDDLNKHIKRMSNTFVIVNGTTQNFQSAVIGELLLPPQEPSHPSYTASVLQNQLATSIHGPSNGLIGKKISKVNVYLKSGSDGKPVVDIKIENELPSFEREYALDYFGETTTFRATGEDLPSIPYEPGTLYTTSNTWNIWQPVTGYFNIQSTIPDDEISLLRRDGPRWDPWQIRPSAYTTTIISNDYPYWMDTRKHPLWDDNDILIMPENIPAIVDTLWLCYQIRKIGVFTRKTGSPWPNQKDTSDAIMKYAQHQLNEGFQGIIRSATGNFFSAIGDMIKSILVPLTMSGETRTLEIKPVSSQSELLLREQLANGLKNLETNMVRDGPTTVKINGLEQEVQSIKIIRN